VERTQQDSHLLSRQAYISCTKCNRQFTRSKFALANSARTGHTYRCKDCGEKYGFNIKKYSSPMERAKLRLVQQAWNVRNPGYTRELNKTPYQRFLNYVRSAKARDIVFGLTPEQFMCFWEMGCYYCGTAIETIGLDRVDWRKGYVLGNLVPCCGPCNVAKHRMTPRAYIALCKKVARRHKCHQ